MDDKTLLLRCPHSDQLNDGLIEAYRSLEDQGIFAYDLDNVVSTIHAAIEEHRRGCMICSGKVGEDHPHVRRTVHLH